MGRFQIILDWSEVWALLIPLTIILMYRPKGPKTGWLVLYVVVGLLLNTISTVIAQFYDQMPSWLKNNNIFYNIHSVVRVLLFSLYIISVKPYKYPHVLRGILWAYLVFVIINFSFIEPLLFLSPNLFAAESIVLLIMCLFYFFRTILDETETHWPSFMACIGICFYEVITFFVFLFFNIVSYSTDPKDRAFARSLLLIYAISFIILCILLAFSLYKGRNKRISRAQL